MLFQEMSSGSVFWCVILSIGYLLSIAGLLTSFVTFFSFTVGHAKRRIFPFIWSLYLFQFLALFLLSWFIYAKWLLQQEIMIAEAVECRLAIGITVSNVMLVPNFILFGLHIFLAVPVLRKDNLILLGFLIFLAMLIGAADGLLPLIHSEKYIPYLHTLLCDLSLDPGHWGQLREFIEFLFFCGIPLLGSPMIGSFIKPPYFNLKWRLKLVVLALILIWLPDNVMRFMDSWLWTRSQLKEMQNFQLLWSVSWQSVLYPLTLLLLILKVPTIDEDVPISPIEDTGSVHTPPNSVENSFIRIR